MGYFNNNNDAQNTNTNVMLYYLLNRNKSGADLKLTVYCGKDIITFSNGHFGLDKEKAIKCKVKFDSKAGNFKISMSKQVIEKAKEINQFTVTVIDIQEHIEYLMIIKDFEKDIISDNKGANSFEIVWNMENDSIDRSITQCLIHPKEL